MFTFLKKIFAQPASVPSDNKPLTQVSDLALYHFGFCPYCRMVRSNIKRLNLSIELRDIHEQEQHLQDLITGGGKKTVPCLQITEPNGDHTWLYESADIVTYLNKRFEK